MAEDRVVEKRVALLAHDLRGVDVHHGGQGRAGCISLAPGGRLAISDIVAIAPIPARVKNKLQAHSGCIAGSATVLETERMLKNAGFSKIRIAVKEQSKEFIKDWFPGSGAEKYVRSATIEAIRKG